jgi:hypothetical protein
MKIILNKKLEAENISFGCVNPYDVKFDLWDPNKEDFTAEDVNVLDAYEKQLLNAEEASAILTAAGMSYIVIADCSDPEGHVNQASAEKAAANIRASLEPQVFPVRQWLEEWYD